MKLKHYIVLALISFSALGALFFINTDQDVGGTINRLPAMTQDGTKVVPRVSGSAIEADEMCLTGDSCITSWGGGSMTALPHTQLFVGNSSNNATATNTITILDSGYVGIATATPYYTLDVDGTIRADNYIGIESDDVGLNTVNGLERTLSDYMDTIQSAGYVSGGDFTDNGDGTAKISAGAGFIKTTNAVGGASLGFTWAENASLSLTSNTTNYIYVDYNSGTPIIAVSTTNPTDFRTIIHLGKIYKNGSNVLHLFKAGSYIPEHTTSNIKRWVAERGEVALTGGGEVAETGARYITVNAATLYGGIVRTTTSAVDTSGADTFTQYYTDGTGGWNESEVSQINNTQYDNGGTLTNLSNNRHRTDFFYIDNDGHISAILGTNNNYFISDAQEVAPPSSVPNIISQFATLIAKSIVKEGETNLEEIDNLETGATFSSSGTVVHNETTGLQGGTADEYYHLNSSEHTELTAWLDDVTLESDGATTLPKLTMTGNIGLGSNWLSSDGDSEGIYVANDGMVGIGTNSPHADYPLTIQPVSQIGIYENLLKYNDYDGNEEWHMVLIDSESLSYTESGVADNVFLLQAGGNIAFADASPDFALEIARKDSANGYFGVSSAPANDGDIFIIDENGNVGIGDSTPSYKLDVDGTLRATGALTIGAYTLPNTDGTADYVLKTNGSGSLTWVAQTDTTYTAGDHITLTGTDFDVDDEATAYKAKIAFETPTDADDFFFGEISTAVTFDSIYCKTLVGTVTLDVTIAGSDINGTDITCTTSGVLDSSLGGDTAGAVGEEVKLEITSVASDPTFLMLELRGQYND